MEPTLTLSNIKCCFDSGDMFIENEGVNKVICLADGRIIEMFNENVKGSCNTPYLNPSDISVFHSFEPLVKYYIIKENTTLGVIRKINGQLEVYRTYENVQKYEISDFLVIGRPQVKIWLLDEMEPLLTDFTSNNLCRVNDQKKVHKISDLDRKLYMLQSSLTHTREISKNREELLKNYFKQSSNDRSSLTFTCEPWQRIVKNRWAICVSIKNSCEHELDVLKLLINNDINSDIETKICNLMYLKPKQFFTRKRLLPNCCAYVVGIVKEPDFNYWKDTVNLSCSLLYKLSNDEGNIKELKIPSFILNIEDLLNKNFSILNSCGENLMQDVIICAAIFETILLEINLKPVENEALITDILLKKLHFNEFEIFESEKIHCYIIKSNSNSMLSGLVVFIENLTESDCTLVCYSERANQVALFKQSLELFLKNELLNINEKRIGFSPEVPAASLLAAVNTLDEEFEHFTLMMRKAIPVSTSLPIKEETVMEFTADTWKGLVESNLQFNTDLQFQSTSKSGNNSNFV